MACRQRLFYLKTTIESPSPPGVGACIVGCRSRFRFRTRSRFLFPPPLTRRAAIVHPMQRGKSQGTSCGRQQYYINRSSECDASGANFEPQLEQIPPSIPPNISTFGSIVSVIADPFLETHSSPSCIREAVPTQANCPEPLRWNPRRTRNVR